MAEDAFSIVELTGALREVHLFDRALPYQGLKTPSAQRYVSHWYPGNKVATIQVLGPTVGDWKVEGMWKSRFLLAERSVDLRGFEDIENTNFTVAAEDLIVAIERIIEAGQQVEVSWGAQVRRGLLVEFEPDWDRREDVRWSMTFTWAQRGADQPRRATAAVDRSSAVKQAMDELDAVLTDQPAAITSRKTLGSLVADARSANLAFLVALQRAQRSTLTTVAEIQGVQAAGERVVQAMQAICRGQIADLPYYESTPLDDLATVLEVEIWNRGVTHSARHVAAETRRTTRGLDERTEPGVIAVVTITDGVSLRHLARRYLGSADAWPLIADANNLVSAIVPVGTRVRIPRPPEQGVRQ